MHSLLAAHEAARQVVAPEKSPWGFGWEALVAIGTLALAVFTARLASQTKALAEQTAQEVGADNRPVLVPVPTKGAPGPAVRWESKWGLDIEFSNVGKGPALDLHGTINFRPPGQRPSAHERAVSTAAVGVGEQVLMAFDDLDRPPEGKQSWFTCSYKDVAGAQHATFFRLELDPSAEQDDLGIWWFIRDMGVV